MSTIIRSTAMTTFCRRARVTDQQNILHGIRWVIWAIPVYDKQVSIRGFSGIGCIRRQPIVVEFLCQGDPTRQLTTRS